MNAKKSVLLKISVLLLLVLFVVPLAACQSSDSELVPAHENDCVGIDPSFASEIKVAYCQYTNNKNYSGEQQISPSDVYILRYEGKVGACHLVMMGGDGIDYTQALHTVRIAGYDIAFGSGQPLYAYYDGLIFTLDGAYANGLIDKADVYEIGCKAGVGFEEEYPTP